MQSILTPVALLAEATTPSVGGGPDLSWLMATSAILILTIGLIAYAFRRLVVGGWKGRAGARDMRVLDVLPLGGKRQLAVVRCYDRTFALGLGEKSVEVVAELDSAVVDHDREGRAVQPQSGSARAAFEAKLRSARERLLGAHDLIPQPSQAEPSALELAAEGGPPAVELPAERPGSTKEFIA